MPTPFFVPDKDTFVPNEIAQGGWGPTLGGQVVGGLLARANTEAAHALLERIAAGTAIVALAEGPGITATADGSNWVLSGTAATDHERVRRVLLAAGARVVGIVTEAEVREDLGVPADLAWLRDRRRTLLEWLTAALR